MAEAAARARVSACGLMMRERTGRCEERDDDDDDGGGSRAVCRYTHAEMKGKRRLT